MTFLTQLSEVNASHLEDMDDPVVVENMPFVLNVAI